MFLLIISKLFNFVTKYPNYKSFVFYSRASSALMHIEITKRICLSEDSYEVTQKLAKTKSTNLIGNTDAGPQPLWKKARSDSIP